MGSLGSIQPLACIAREVLLPLLELVALGHLVGLHLELVCFPGLKALLQSGKKFSQAYGGILGFVLCRARSWMILVSRFQLSIFYDAMMKSLFQ